jgi:hypothetical protein
MNADAVLKNALLIYCDFINSFVPDDETESHYRPADFTDDRENGHYGFTLLQLIHPQPCDYQTLYVYRVSIGDEGGPATLYVWADDDNTITHMTHLFDTMLSNVASTNGMSNELVIHKGGEET